MRHQLELDPLDVVALGILPFFHSFGFTVGIWTILLLGKKAVYHSNPLDAKIIGDLCEKHKVTLIAASPTFARHYIQRKPEQFATLVHLLLGAEKLKPETARGDPRQDPPRAAGGLRHDRDVAGGRGERPVRRDLARRPEGPRQPAGDGRPAPARARRSRPSTPRPAPTCPRGTEGMILSRARRSCRAT